MKTSIDKIFDGYLYNKSTRIERPFDARYYSEGIHTQNLNLYYPTDLLDVIKYK